ncbi:unnamed protein product [Dimorphilus gyrociliatus]|uniref:NECAP PHear domain-containing protein n=1 Tax=Dimorphilus gyrociliatus TaxID=2664684 RepID=A0A7I8VXV0_9ANNE|nr:unnamed protein product [Dimorphilus gyrociliatus]
MDDYESVLCVKNEVFVYRIPPRSSNRGYRAAEWGLDNPDWTGRMRIIARGKKVFIKLEDKSTTELFAECPVEEYPGPSVEQVLDSSRYFVIRIQDPSGRKAFIGIGFADRGDAFDLNVALQDHFKWAKRETELEQTGGASNFDPGPKLDLGFKEGETIKINIQTKKNQEGGRKPRGVMGGSTGILPPPPSGAKISAPSSIRNASAENTNSSLLLDFGNNASAKAPPASDWTDFTGASQQQPQQQQQQQQPDQGANTKNWVQF